MKLYQINKNGNRYCGPAIVSALVGIGTKEAAAIIRGDSERYSVKGTSHANIMDALERLGIDMRRDTAATATRATLRAWASQHAAAAKTYLVVSGNHWIIVQGRWAICGKTTDMVPVKDHPNARTYVTAAYLLQVVKQVDPMSAIPPGSGTRSLAIGESAARRRAMKLAHKHGIRIEQIDEGEVIWIDPPQSFPIERDPYSGEHFCDFWTDALERVETYASLLSTIKKAEGATFNEIGV